MTLAATPAAAYRQGVYDTVQLIGNGLDRLAHAERDDPCASDQAAQAARQVRSMGRTLAAILARWPDTDVGRLPELWPAPPPPPPPVVQLPELVR